MELARYMHRNYSTISNDVSQTIERAHDDELAIHGYVPVRWKVVVSRIIAVVTFGLWLLILRWKPKWKATVKCRPCSLKSCSHLLIKDCNGQWEFLSVQEPVPTTRSQLSVQSTDEESGVIRSERYFVHQFLKYVWNSRNNTFVLLRGLDHGTACTSFFDTFQGLDESQQKIKREKYGPNIMDLRVKSYGSLFIDEVLNPFYFFQIASITLWSLDEYYYYASCIFIISLISISVSLYETKKQMKALKDMITSGTPQTVMVQRLGGDVQEMLASEIVPGDIVVIPSNGCIMACDAVLTTGNCIVNESMLTGECVPETKTPLVKSGEDLDVQKHKKNILFCGTEVIQTRYYGNSNVTATVIRTGFSTAKGELVRSILFPKPMGFQFYRDSMRFVLILLGLAACGMSYALYLYISRNASVGETIKKVLDIVTIVVPPALPAALTVGTVYAQSRLKNKGIFCISPPRINLAGKVKLMCFDKTGTLTEGGLDFWGLVPVENARFEKVVRENPRSLGDENDAILAMATCHSLTSINGELAGDPLDLKMFQATEWVLEEFGKDTNRFDLLVPSIVRPPRGQDYWALSQENSAMVDGNFISSRDCDPTNEIVDIVTKPLPLEVGLVRQFPFSSSLQCMSVICRVLGSSHMDLYSKGAPEKIATLCTPDSVPSDFNEVLQKYTQQGFRVLALARKELSDKLSWHQAQRIKREKLECDMTMVGLLVMQNALKRETSPVISVLRHAAIRMVMITGDNILTATSVGRDCGLIKSHQQVVLVSADKDGLTFDLAETPAIHNNENITNNLNTTIEMSPLKVVPGTPDSSVHLSRDYCMALEGKAFTSLKNNFPGIFQRVLMRCTIFARMSPDEKTQLVESFQELGYVVGMCGDGANDCGALKAADLGISLSEAEASVAAPFTSRIDNVQCVPIVIREGRCALVTSFAMFKFIALYSIIQFVSVLILYSKGSNLSDAMFMYIDLGIITVLAMAMGNTKAHPDLVKERPLSALVNPANVASMMLQVILVTLVQAITISYLMAQSWYVPQVINRDDIHLVCWDTTSIFLVSAYQYLIVGVVFSQGAPYRKPFYSNMWYLLALVLLIGFTTLLLFSPWPQLLAAFQMVEWSNTSKAILRYRIMLLLFAFGNCVVAFTAEIMIARSDWLKRLMRWARRKKSPKNVYRRLEALLQASEVAWPPLRTTITADLVRVS